MKSQKTEIIYPRKQEYKKNNEWKFQKLFSVKSAQEDLNMNN